MKKQGDIRGKEAKIELKIQKNGKNESKPGVNSWFRDPSTEFILSRAEWAQSLP